LVTEALPCAPGSKNFVSRVILGVSNQDERTSRKPSIVRLLRLAEIMKAQLENGARRCEGAEQHGVSRPRVTQLLNLLHLHPAILPTFGNSKPEIRACGDRTPTAAARSSSAQGPARASAAQHSRIPASRRPQAVGRRVVDQRITRVR